MFARFVSRACSPFRSDAVSSTVGVANAMQMILLVAAVLTVAVAADICPIENSCLKQVICSSSSPFASSRFVDNECDARTLSRAVGKELAYIYFNSEEQVRRAETARRRFVHDEVRVAGDRQCSHFQPTSVGDRADSIVNRYEGQSD